MGFHSYRNIGFSFTDAEVTCRKWRDRFSGFDSDATDYVHYEAVSFMIADLFQKIDMLNVTE